MRRPKFETGTNRKRHLRQRKKEKARSGIQLILGCGLHFVLKSSSRTMIDRNVLICHHSGSLPEAGQRGSFPFEYQLTVIDDATTSTRPAAASACCGLGRLLRGDERLPLMYRFNWFKQRAAYGLRRVQRVDSVDPQAVGSHTQSSQSSPDQEFLPVLIILYSSGHLGIPNWDFH